MKLNIPTRKWIFLSLACASIGLIAYGIGWTSLVSVHNISITGSTQSIALKNELSHSHRLFVNMPMARVNIRHIRRTLFSNTWIKSIQISRDWMHGKIAIVIQERTPVAQYQSRDGQTHYFDNDGKDFSASFISPQLPNISFSTNSEPLRLAAAQILRAIPQELLDSLKGMAVVSLQFIDTTHEIKLKKNKVRIFTIRWGSAEKMSLKIKVFQSLFTLEENKSARLFDLSTPGTPITK